MTGRELSYINQAHQLGWLAGDGVFTKKCQNWLEDRTRTIRALLTHSCTGALELAAIVAGIGPGDEVIMPSYTFVSTANAFVLRGATPVFVDIRPDTLNLDETLLEPAITPRTKAIVPVHYAGIACEMDAIMAVAKRHGLIVIEDAAQAIMSSYRGQALGTIGHLGALSFHETKNIIAGEGGALLINDPALVARAEIVREKGTNRSNFFRGHVDKYTWVDIGSSFLPSELVAAFLWAQMEDADEITRRRLALWERYHNAFLALERDGKAVRPSIPDHCQQNAHMYRLLLPSSERRSAFIAALREAGIASVFHYVPLHNAPAGLRYGRSGSALSQTEDLSRRVVRLPMWLGLENHLGEVIRSACAAAQ